MKRLPPLNTLRAFEAAGRLESFHQAGEELSVTPSAVSHQIRSLESFLGVELFNRRPRQVRLTEAGRSFLPPISDALLQIASAAEHVRRANESPVVVVTAAPTFAVNWLVPRLADFYAAHPELEVRLDTSVELIDFQRSDVDVAIRQTSNPRSEGLVTHPLLREELVPVCSPGTAKQLNEPADLGRFTLLHSAWRTDQWASWLSAAGATEIRADRGQRVPNDSVALEAAANGLGIALANRSLVARQLAEGRLVAPFRTAYWSDYGYYLVYPEAVKNDARIVAFRDWLFAITADEEASPDVAPIA